MPRGFGRGGAWWGFGSYGWGGYPWWGRGGRGNPFGFCRWFPWLPRWWPFGMLRVPSSVEGWATPYASSYAATIPCGGYGYPYYGTGYGTSYGYPGTGTPYGFAYGYPGYAPGYPATTPPPAATPPK